MGGYREEIAPAIANRDKGQVTRKKIQYNKQYVDINIAETQLSNGVSALY